MKTVLIADSQAEAAEILAEALKTAGMNALWAESRDEAEKMLVREHCDFLVTNTFLKDGEDAGFVLCYHAAKISPETRCLIFCSSVEQTGIFMDYTPEEFRNWIRAEKFLSRDSGCEAVVRFCKE